MARHYARTYGSNTELFLGDAKEIADLGEHFGHELYEAELRHRWNTNGCAVWTMPSGVVLKKGCG